MFRKTPYKVLVNWLCVAIGRWMGSIRMKCLASMYLKIVSRYAILLLYYIVEPLHIYIIQRLLKYSPPYSRVHWSSQIWSLAVSKHWGRKKGLRNRKTPRKEAFVTLCNGTGICIRLFLHIINRCKQFTWIQYQPSQYLHYIPRYIFLRSWPLFFNIAYLLVFSGIFADLKNLIVTFHKTFPPVCIKKRP